MILSQGSFFCSPDVSIGRDHECSLHAESSWNQRGLMSNIQITAELFLTQDAYLTKQMKETKDNWVEMESSSGFPRWPDMLYEAPAIKLKDFGEAALWCLLMTASQPFMWSCGTRCSLQAEAQFNSKQFLRTK